MQKYRDTVTDRNGNALLGVSVLVQNYPALTTATIYSDNGVTPIVNPLTTDAYGTFAFYAADGRYSLTLSGSNIATTTLSDIPLLEDPADGFPVYSAPSGSFLIGFLQSGTGAVARTVQAKLRERVSVEDFGAVGDGVVDDTIAIQKAIDSGAQNIHFTRGTYRITDTITVNHGNIGLTGTAQGFSPTILLDEAGGTKDIFKFIDGTNTINSLYFSNLVFTRNQIGTSGAAVNLSRCGAVRFTNCNFYGQDKLYTAVKMFRTIQVVFDQCNGVGTVGTMFDWSGNSGVDKSIDVAMYDSRFEQGGASCIRVGDFCEGLFIKDCILFDFVGSVVEIIPTGANIFASGKIQNCDIDTSTNYGIYAVNAQSLLLTSNWYSALQRGVYLKDCVEVEVGGSGIMYPAQVGVEIDGGTNITISSQAIATAATAAVKFSAASSEVTIVGNRFRINAVAVAFGATPPSNITMDSNGFHGNTSDFSGTNPTTNFVSSGNNLTGGVAIYRAEDHKFLIDNSDYGELLPSGVWRFGLSTSDFVKLSSSVGNGNFDADGVSAAVAFNMRAKGNSSINGYLQGGSDLMFQALRGGGASGDSYIELRQNSTNVRLTAKGNVPNLDLQLISQGTGDVLASVANLRVTTAGKGLRVAEGSNAKQGVATLVAGTVVVANTSVTAVSRIHPAPQDNNTVGSVRVSARTPGVSFTLTSNNAADTGVVAYQIFEPG